MSSGFGRTGGAKVAHPKELRARALAALLTGERPAVVARDLGVPEATVRTWKRRLRVAKSETLKKRGERSAGPEFDELLMGHLTESLKALSATSRHLAKPEVFLEIPADELAVVHGTMVDRTIRILEVVEPLLEEEDATP